MPGAENLSTEELMRIASGKPSAASMPTEELMRIAGIGQSSPAGFVNDPAPGAAHRLPSFPVPTEIPTLAGSAGRVFDKIEFKPVTDEEAEGRFLGTAGQVGQNLFTGAIRGATEFPLSLVDALGQSLAKKSPEPLLEAGKSLVKFVPEQVETVGKALGSQKASQRINQRTGLVQRQREITPEETATARRELREHPEGPVFAAGLAFGAGRGIAKRAKPSPAEAPRTAPEPIRSEQKAVNEFFETQPEVSKIANKPLEQTKVTPEAPVSAEQAKITVEKGELAGKTARPESGIAKLRTFQDAISLDKEGFDKSIQKKVTERFRDIALDKSIGPKVKREKRRQLRNVMTELQARESGVATRETKAGNVRGSIRRAGIFVPAEFTKYEGFKDLKGGTLTKDPTVAIQQMDGALSAEAKVKLPGQEGPVERFVLRRTQKMTLLRKEFNADVSASLQTMTKGLSKPQRKSAFDILEKIGRTDALADPARLVKRSDIAKITTDPVVIKFAQEARKTFDHLLEVQNEFRRKRKQSLIPRRTHYTPDVLKQATIWDKAQFWNKNPREIMTGPDLPDFIKPNKPFNPHELQKKGLLKDFEKVNDLGELLERYSNAASRDIFNTSIIQNNKAFAEQLRSMGLDVNARYIEDWTAEAFTGVKAGVDRAFHVGRKTSKFMTFIRSSLNRSVFPLNFAWNITVQTSSSALTTARYGFKNSAAGAFDWFTNKALRREVERKAYSAVIKRDKASRVTRQDTGVGSTGRIKFRTTKFENAVDAANFFTEWTERHLTGWSVATAKRHGEALGFKGDALWDYASDGGAKTQSMYNFEDAPPILRNELVKTAAPFQTFSFTMYNTMKEFAGKTGTPPATFKKRAAMGLRFLAGVSALNYIGSVTTGREPWDARGFVPFYGLLFSPLEGAATGDHSNFGKTRQLPSPIGIGVQLVDGIEELITKGKWDKLRQWLIKFGSAGLGIPAGTQANKTVEGLIAISEGGDFDAAGRMKYPIREVDDKLIAITMGKYATPGGQAYLDGRANERKRLADAFLKPNPLKILLEDDPNSSDRPPLKLKQLKPKTLKKKTLRPRR